MGNEYSQFWIFEGKYVPNKISSGKIIFKENNDINPDKFQYFVGKISFLDP